MAQPSALVLSEYEPAPLSATVTPARGLPSRSVTSTAAVPAVAEKAPGAGVRMVVSVTGLLMLAGEVTVELTFMYSACVLSSVQLTTPLASRTHSVVEWTV